MILKEHIKIPKRLAGHQTGLDAYKVRAITILRVHPCGTRALAGKIKVSLSEARRVVSMLSADGFIEMVGGLWRLK